VPTLELEHQILATSGLRFIAGLDEAGRGAIAGPVVAAAVILSLDQPDQLDTLNEVNDSKQLSYRKREHLYRVIIENVLAYGIGFTAADLIDEFGIIPATKKAMVSALSNLSIAAEYLLIDGRIRLKSIALPQKAIIRGDSKSLSIAAASILAKVARDRHMVELDAQHPQYGLARHKGYGTRHHLDAIAMHGPTSIHRHSFAPIRQRLL